MYTHRASTHINRKRAHLILYSKTIQYLYCIRSGNMQKILTHKGKPDLIVDGYKYRMDKENNSSHLWRCLKRSCNARCKTDVNDLMIIIDNQRMDHSHKPEQDRTLQRQKLRQECKKRALEETTERPKKVIITELGKKEKTETYKLFPEDVSSVRQSVYHVRRKTQPKLPKSREEIHESLTEYSLTSTNGEKMIYVNDSSSGIIMFTTNSDMRYICQSDVDIFCDGTFKYCPHLCYQLYTFLGFINGQYIQCILFLLPSKSKPVYLKMLQFFIDSCKEN